MLVFLSHLFYLLHQLDDLWTNEHIALPSHDFPIRLTPEVIQQKRQLVSSSLPMYGANHASENARFRVFLNAFVLA